MGPVASEADRRSAPGPTGELIGLFAAALASLDLSEESAVPLARLTDLLHRWNQSRNLTGHPDVQSIAENLVLDAVCLSKVLPEAGSLVDLGSGAGFPGLPLAILRPERPTLLVEARERRVHFQRAAIRALGLRQVECRRGRIEDSGSRRFGLVTAQALAPPSRAVASMLPWVEPGGSLAIPGAGASPSLPPGVSLERQEIVVYRTLHGRPRPVWLGIAHA